MAVYQGRFAIFETLPSLETGCLYLLQTVCPTEDLQTTFVIAVLYAVSDTVWNVWQSDRLRRQRQK